MLMHLNSHVTVWFTVNTAIRLHQKCCLLAHHSFCHSQLRGPLNIPIILQDRYDLTFLPGRGKQADMKTVTLMVQRKVVHINMRLYRLLMQRCF